MAVSGEQHSLLTRQILQSTSPDGTFDLDKLLLLVSNAYRDNDKDRQRTDRSITLMVEELEAANAEARDNQNKRFEAAISNMSHGLSMLDGDRRLVICNEAYRRMYGLPEDLIRPGTSFWDLLDHGAKSGMVSIADPAERRRVLEAVIAARKPVKEPLTMVNGRVILASHQPLPDGGWLAIHEDITEQHRSEELIRHLARHDPLTGLPNRTTFLEAMAAAERNVAEGKVMAVLCIDLDHFKPINDNLGHAAGDAVLKRAAERIRARIGTRGVVARLGGDEFAALIGPLAGVETAAEIAYAVIASVSEPISADGLEVSVGVSIGIAVGPRDGTDTDSLMRNGDLALYRAKRDNRGGLCFFEPEMDQQQKRRRAIEVALKEGLTKNEFSLAFQPLISLRENRIRCVEALARWTSRALGQVAPIEFIPVAEETGLIRDLGKWVLLNACSIASGWPADVRVAVNISPGQFKGNDLVGQVETALKVSGLEAERLELEITESLFLADNAQNLEILHALRRLGVRIALDDFGTGYSSLSYLRSFPFDRIKIDRCFISNLSGTSDTLPIVKAIVDLGTSLGMQTVAEGVETEEQLEIVTAKGCAEAQGYLFSPPLPESAIRTLLGSDPHLLPRHNARAG